MQLSQKIALGSGPHGQAVVCTSPLGAEERLFRLIGDRVPVPGKYTIQMADNEHLAPEDETLWALINHDCDPNCRIDFASWELVARRPIAAGEEITYNYLSTEWELAAPFDCQCGAPHCHQRIRGFRHLARPHRQVIRPLLSPFLISRLALGEETASGTRHG